MAAIADPQRLSSAPDPAPGVAGAPIPQQGRGSRVAGHADLGTRPDFELLLLTLCGQAVGDVHLDLGELDFIDVSGVIALMRAAESLPKGHHLVLTNPPESMRRILDLLGPAVAESGVLVR